MSRAFIFLIVFVLTFLHAQGQSTPPLERQLTISFRDQPVESALQALADRGDFTFSYAAGAVAEERPITGEFVDKTVREILDQLFNGRVAYKSRGDYIILTRPKKKEQQAITLKGYVIDETSGQRLSNVTVYEPVTLASAMTDSFGYFEMEVPRPPSDLRLSIHRMNYSDTVIHVSNRQRLMNISMKVNRRLDIMTDSVGSKLKRLWNKPKKESRKEPKLYKRQRVTMANVQDTLYRDIQVSFLPFAGSNHGMSGNVVNKYSLNVLGGYSMGTTKFELGGLFNIARHDVTGFQAAGLFNHVGHDFDGVQLSGLWNFNGGTASGIVVGGIANVSPSAATGVQLAGIANASSSATIQIAGVINATKDVSVAQVAGVVNATQELSGAQIAGVANVATKGFTGSQIAGVLNVAGGDVDGVQVGVMNVGLSIDGAQVGVFNVADSVTGIPVGLISFVAKGYHKIELSADEVFSTNLAFRTGVRGFYNIITAGIKPRTLSNAATLWTFGYGVGTAPALSRTVALNIDVSSHQVMEGNSLKYLNLLNRLTFGVDVQLSPKISLTAGGTLNLYLTDSQRDDYWPLFTRSEPNIFYHKIGDSVERRMWFGGRVGIRFL